MTIDLSYSTDKTHLPAYFGDGTECIDDDDADYYQMINSVRRMVELIYWPGDKKAA